MFKLFVPLSISLIASVSLTMPVKAELSTKEAIANPGSSCLESLNQSAMTSKNTTIEEFQLAQVILDTRPSFDSRCGDYYTTIKHGDVYECIKCEYGGPYCWEKH